MKTTIAATIGLFALLATRFTSLFLIALLCLTGSQASAELISYRIGGDGKYQSFVQLGFDFDEIYNFGFGNGSTYFRHAANQIKLGNDYSYVTPTPEYAGTPLFTISDIDDVMLSTGNSLYVKVDGTSYSIGGDGKYQSFEQRGFDFDEIYNFGFGNGSTYFRHAANQIKLGNDYSYVTPTPEYAGTPLFTVSDIDDVMLSTGNSLYVRIQSSSVPEPSTLLLSTLATAIVFFPRRRQ